MRIEYIFCNALINTKLITNPGSHNIPIYDFHDWYGFSTSRLLSHFKITTALRTTQVTSNANVRNNLGLLYCVVIITKQRINNDYFYTYYICIYIVSKQLR